MPRTTRAATPPPPAAAAKSAAPQAFPTPAVGGAPVAGDGDGTVPFEGSGKRTHEAIKGSELVVIDDGPHGINASHAEAFNAALIAFLSR